MEHQSQGFDEALRYPLFSAIAHRRSRRISKGLRTVAAGSLTYESTKEPQPLSPLEEALLIAATGTTGMTMPDRPFQEAKDGPAILGTPNLLMPGRAAGSADNAQATHFFLINDSGTYYLRRLPPVDPDTPLTPETLIARAEMSKQLVLRHRVDFPRRFPFYLDSNRFLSNLPGSTILLPVVDTTRQYINGLMYLLTEPDGLRPSIVDDRNFYLPAGTKRWLRNGFLNREIKIPLVALGMFRVEWEVGLLLQNLMLTLQAMGLGGWIHATISPPFLLGHPMFAKEGPGLGFRYEIPRFRPLDMIRWGTFLPKVRANPVGLDGVMEGLCPPYCKSMAEAVDAVVAQKYGPDGTYSDRAAFERIFKPGLAEPYLREAPHYEDEVIACVKDICTYIYERHGRFPAHADAIYLPGLWLQAHHLDLDYYDHLFAHGYTETHRRHHDLWHGSV